jgi:hypothetical protein
MVIFKASRAVLADFARRILPDCPLEATTISSATPRTTPAIPAHADIFADTKGPRGTPNKTATQGFGSTMSYGRRYLKALMFDLVIAGEDDDGTHKRKLMAHTALAQMLVLNWQ